MIDIGGELHEQPSDWSIVSYDGGKYVTITTGDTFQRVLMSELAQPAHNHDGQILYPVAVFGPTASGELRLGGALMGYGSNIYLYGETHGSKPGWAQIAARKIEFNSSDIIKFITVATDKVQIHGTVGQRTAVADAWNLWPCTLASKEDVQQIDNPVSRVKQSKGITYTQNGKANTGMSAEDLDATGLPGVTEKDKDGNYQSINPTAVIGLLFEAVKELSSRLEALEQSK